MEEKLNFTHKIIIDERKNLNISGVLEVKAFDDETLILDTVLGGLTIKGEELHIISFNTETADLIAVGKTHAAVYTSLNNKGSFLKRVFR